MYTEQNLMDPLVSCLRMLRFLMRFLCMRCRGWERGLGRSSGPGGQQKGGWVPHLQVLQHHSAGSGEAVHEHNHSSGII